ncbi:MAG: hypothetical protein DRQ55_10385 [Planctomycetota bacterium]|nr:MAG: hypothetical protein DRQ55_10385 [Planctomycetota bacterium]
MVPPDHNETDNRELIMGVSSAEKWGAESDCERARAVLCRLALGGHLGQEPLGLARHVRGCGACDGFLDELAALRDWLAGRGRLASSAVDDEVLVAGARAAVVRELEARLARDLLARVTVRRGRPRPEVEADLRRCELLRRASSVTDDDWGRVRAGLAGHGRPRQAAQLLGLAACLDRTGLDLTLAWVASLSRGGEQQLARREAQRYLSHMEGLVAEAEPAPSASSAGASW